MASAKIKLTHLEVHKCLKAAVSRNYRFRWIDVEFGRYSITWYLAVQFRNDPQRNWHPRIVTFYPGEQRVAVSEKLGDKPMFMDVAILKAMAGDPKPGQSF